MTFFRSYMKPGKGVDPDAQPKRAFFRFFEIIGRKLWKMAKVNLLYAIAVIPTFVLVFWLSGYITYAMSSVLGGEDQSMVLLFDSIIRFILTYLFTVIWEWALPLRDLLISCVILPEKNMSGYGAISKMLRGVISNSRQLFL